MQRGRGEESSHLCNKAGLAGGDGDDGDGDDDDDGDGDGDGDDDDKYRVSRLTGPPPKSSKYGTGPPQ